MWTSAKVCQPEHGTSRETLRLQRLCETSLIRRVSLVVSFPAQHLRDHGVTLVLTATAKPGYHKCIASEGIIRKTTPNTIPGLLSHQLPSMNPIKDRLFVQGQPLSPRHPIRKPLNHYSQAL